MGLRGSRVQIPPSRLLTELGAVGGRFLPRMPPTSRKLALLAHDGGKRFVIRLLVALEEGSRGRTRTCDPLTRNGHGLALGSRTVNSWRAGNPGENSETHPKRTRPTVP